MEPAVEQGSHSVTTKQDVSVVVDFDEATRLLTTMTRENCVPGLSRMWNVHAQVSSVQKVLRFAERGDVVIQRPVACFMLADPAGPDVAAIVVGGFGVGFTAGGDAHTFLVHQTNPDFAFPYQSNGIDLQWSPAGASTEATFSLTLLGLRAMCLISAITSACQKAGVPRLVLRHLTDADCVLREMDLAREAVATALVSISASCLFSAQKKRRVRFADQWCMKTAAEEAEAAAETETQLFALQQKLYQALLLADVREAVHASALAALRKDVIQEQLLRSQDQSAAAEKAAALEKDLAHAQAELVKFSEYRDAVERILRSGCVAAK